MSKTTYPLRLQTKDRRLFARSAKAEGKTLAAWLREAARERAERGPKKWACLDYPDWPLSESAERDKHFLKRKLGGKL